MPLGSPVEPDEAQPCAPFGLRKRAMEVLSAEELSAEEQGLAARAREAYCGARIGGLGHAGEERLKSVVLVLPTDLQAPSLRDPFVVVEGLGVVGHGLVPLCWVKDEGLVFRQVMQRNPHRDERCRMAVPDVAMRVAHSLRTWVLAPSALDDANAPPCRSTTIRRAMSRPRLWVTRIACR